MGAMVRPPEGVVFDVVESYFVRPPEGVVFEVVGVVRKVVGVVRIQGMYQDNVCDKE